MASLRRDDGAVAIIVGLMLPALIAMSALVVDVGWLEYNRTAAQNAADAGALAAAQSCEHGDTDMALQASSLAESNWHGATTTESGCGTGHTIDVHVEQVMPTFMAGIFGVHTAPVSADAQAGWSTGTTIHHCSYTQTFVSSSVYDMSFTQPPFGPSRTGITDCPPASAAGVPYTAFKVVNLATHTAVLGGSATTWRWVNSTAPTGCLALATCGYTPDAWTNGPTVTINWRAPSMSASVTFDWKAAATSGGVRLTG